MDKTKSFVAIVQKVEASHKVADGIPLPVMGQFSTKAQVEEQLQSTVLQVVVTKVPKLNSLLGRLATMRLGLNSLTGYCKQYSRSITVCDGSKLAGIMTENVLQAA